jgi:hypothetical protein
MARVDNCLTKLAVIGFVLPNRDMPYTPANKSLDIQGFGVSSIANAAQFRTLVGVSLVFTSRTTR